MMLLKHTMSANLTRPIKIKPDAMAILEPRWSDISPEEGTEACLCSWCSKMIGRDRVRSGVGRSYRILRRLRALRDCGSAVRAASQRAGQSP